MDPLTIGLLGSSALSGITGLLGGQNQAKATQEASKQQAMMQALALQQQAQQYAQNRADLAPYRGFGETAGNQLISRLPELTQGFSPTQAQLEQTPGYQFNLSQGLKATQNSAAARGLGMSGAAMKGAANYATGLADNTLKTQADIFYNNQNNAYNKLYGVTGLGVNAAGATVTAGQNNMNQQTNLLTGIGNVGAAGTIGSAAAQNQGLGSIGQSIGNLPLMYYYGQRIGEGGSGSGGGIYGTGMYPAGGTLDTGSPDFAAAQANPALYGVQGTY